MATKPSRKPHWHIDAEWRARIAQLNAPVLARAPKHAELRDLLQRRVPGSLAVIQYEKEHLDALLKRGTLVKVGPDSRWTVEYVEGGAHRCHWNVAKIYRNNPKRFDIATGYALSDDGLWRQHSWVVHRNAKVIVETTVPRLAYFGIRLSGIRRTFFLFAHRDC